MAGSQPGPAQTSTRRLHLRRHNRSRPRPWGVRSLRRTRRRPPFEGHLGDGPDPGKTRLLRHLAETVLGRGCLGCPQVRPAERPFSPQRTSVLKLRLPVPLPVPLPASHFRRLESRCGRFLCPLLQALQVRAPSPPLPMRYPREHPGDRPPWGQGTRSSAIIEMAGGWLRPRLVLAAVAPAARSGQLSALKCGVLPAVLLACVGGSPLFLWGLSPPFQDSPFWICRFLPGPPSGFGVPAPPPGFGVPASSLPSLGPRSSRGARRCLARAVRSGARRL